MLAYRALRYAQLLSCATESPKPRHSFENSKRGKWKIDEHAHVLPTPMAPINSNRTLEEVECPANRAIAIRPGQG